MCNIVQIVGAALDCVENALPNELQAVEKCARTCLPTSQTKMCTNTKADLCSNAYFRTQVPVTQVGVVVAVNFNSSYIPETC